MSVEICECGWSDRRVGRRTVEIAGGLDRRVTQTKQGLVRLVVAAAAHEPSRALWAEEHLHHEEQRGDAGLRSASAAAKIQQKEHRVRCRA